MKKRLLSLALCLALCLGLLPVGVLATDGRVYEDTGDPEAASVIRADGTTTNYATLPAALNAAQDGDTVKLLANHTTNWSAVEAGEDQMAVVKKRLTLDLNGKTVDYLVVGEVIPDENGGILESNDGNLTVKGSREGTGTNGRITTLKFVRGTLSVQDGGNIGGSSDSSTGLICDADSGTVTITGGTVYNAAVGEGTTVTVSGGSMHAGSWYNDGTLNITGGTFSNPHFCNNAGTIAISGGTFYTIQNLDNNSSQIPPMSLLVPGYAFYDMNNESVVKDGSKRDFLQNVTVKEHTHILVNNKCACGLSCIHTDADGPSTIGVDGKCTVCGTQFAAIVGETYYADMNSALDAATAGQTVKLLADGTLPVANAGISKSLTLDLNGYVLGSNRALTVKSGAALTVTNAGGEKSEKPVKVGLHLTLLVEKGGSFTCTDGVLQYLGLLSAGTGDYAIRLVDGENHCTFGSFAQGDANATVGDLLKASTGMALHADNNGSDIQIERSALINKGFTYHNFYVGACSEHKMDANGACIYCGASYVASVTSSGKTINYTSLDDALDAAKDGNIITLLSDAESTREHWLRTAITLDLNGKTATIQSGASLCIAAKIVVQDSSNEKTGNMTCNDYGTYLLDVQGGDLTIKNGIFNGKIAGSAGGKSKLTIEGGTFNKDVNLGAVSASLSGGTFTRIWCPNSFLNLLADGYAFYNENNCLVNAAQIDDNLYTSSVRTHQHSFSDGICACGYPCPHTSVDASGTCAVCHKQLAASVTVGDAVTYYDTFDNALVYALQNDGCTLKLMAIVTGSTVMINNPFIFDLNGHNVDALSVGAKATIKDSGTTKGSIGTLTVSDTKVPGLTLGDLLEEGYAFKYENGYWANDSHVQTSDGLSVTVEEAPIRSVVLDAKGADGKEVSEVPYGATGTVTLAASCWTTGLTPPSYLWYKLEGATATAPMDGVNGVYYTLPADLPAGEHTYLVTCTSDGYSKSAEITITVTKATPTGEPKYTAITTSGKTLKDAELTVNESWPEGSIHWVDANGTEMDVDTVISANTAYTWKFTPYDKNYNDLTGTITLWHKSSSGSSSGSVTPGTKTDTVKNPDGSTTKTETKADGSKTETTTASSAGGSTGTTVTKTDSQGNRTTEAEAKLSEKDVKNAQETGEAVQVPVKKIEAAKDSNRAPELKIELPSGAGKTTVEIPVEGASSGTVAVIVHPDGTEEIVKDSIPTENGVQLELSGTTTIKILDNSKTFDDTKDHWSRDEVNFVAARELFQGVGNNQFGVSQPMTRGMVNTVLARLAGLDTTPGQGQTWYEVGTDWAVKHGISDGTNPTAPVTREQLATLLYRYAGSPDVSGTLNAADAGAVSDYAKDALLWANQNGIVNGVGNNTIAPKDNAQRAQVAAMLARYLQNQ